jgi:RNA polymerase sigma-70 factor (ECF subfamily)
VVDETRIGGPGREFPPTRWTLILSARGRPEARRAALDELLQTYWKPLYFYVRRKGRDIETAKDVVQGFVVHLLERDFMERLDPGRGRFRSYLRTAVDHYLVNLHESAVAQRRGGGAIPVPLDFDVAERELAGGPSTADAAFDREWALGVMERALARLRAECEPAPFEAALRHFRPGDPPSYADSAAACGMNLNRFKQFLHRTRARFRVILRDEVAQTVAEAGEADAEIGDLLRALAS